MEVPKSPPLRMTGAFSLAAWVNVAELPSSRFGMYVLADYSADGSRSSFALRVLPDGAAQFFWQSDESHSTHATSARRLSPGTWAHLAAVWDGRLRRIYVDGKLERENATPQDRPDVGGSTAIGRPGSFDGLHFRGAIDDVRIYARALSAAEIQALVLLK